MSEERRDAPRVPVRTIVRMYFETIGDFMQTYARNISETGMQLAASKPLEDDALIGLEFRLKSEYPLIEGTARVRWCRPHGQHYLVGVEFDAIDERSRKIIRDAVHMRKDEVDVSEDDVLEADADDALEAESLTEDLLVSPEDEEGVDEIDAEALEVEAEEDTELSFSDLAPPVEPDEAVVEEAEPVDSSDDMDFGDLDDFDPDSVGVSGGSEPEEVPEFDFGAEASSEASGAGVAGDDAAEAGEEEDEFGDLDDLDDLDLDEAGEDVQGDLFAEPTAEELGDLTGDGPSEPEEAEEAPSAEDVGHSVEPASSGRGHRIVVAVSVLVLVALVGGGGWWYLTRGTGADVSKADRPEALPPGGADEAEAAGGSADAADPFAPDAGAPATEVTAVGEDAGSSPDGAPDEDRNDGVAQASRSEPERAEPAPDRESEPAAESRSETVRESAPAPAPEATPGPADRVMAIEVGRGGDELLRVRGDGSFDGQYRYFGLREPPRLVVDLQDVRLADGVRAPSSGVGPLENVRIGRHPDKVRIVLDMSADVGVEVRATDDELIVRLK